MFIIYIYIIKRRNHLVPIINFFFLEYKNDNKKKYIYRKKFQREIDIGIQQMIKHRESKAREKNLLESTLDFHV